MLTVSILPPPARALFVPILCVCEQKLNRFLEGALEEEVIADGTVAQDSAQCRSLWQLRESIAEALSRAGAVYKYDISLPVKSMYDMVDKIRARLGSRADGVLGYGHLGDGNLHLNVHTKKFDPEVLVLIEPYLFEQTGECSDRTGGGVVTRACLPLRLRN